jgi:hypothetical protein
MHQSFVRNATRLKAFVLSLKKKTFSSCASSTVMLISLYTLDSSLQVVIHALDHSCTRSFPPQEVSLAVKQEHSPCIQSHPMLIGSPAYLRLD